MDASFAANKALNKSTRLAGETEISVLHRARIDHFPGLIMPFRVRAENLPRDCELN